MPIEEIENEDGSITRVHHMEPTDECEPNEARLIGRGCGKNIRGRVQIAEKISPEVANAVKKDLDDGGWKEIEASEREFDAGGGKIFKPNEKFARTYGSQDRIDWLRRLPSVASGRKPPMGCVAAHVRTGGMGRKADACWTVPLTWTEHEELHQRGQKTFEAKYKIDLQAAAVATEAAWQKELAGGDL